MKISLNFRSHPNEDPGLKLPKNLQSVPGSFTLQKMCYWSFQLFDVFGPLLRTDIQHDGVQLLDTEPFEIMLTITVTVVLTSAVKTLPSYKNKHDN